MAKLPLQKNYYSRALKDMTENVMYNIDKGMGGIVQTGIFSQYVRKRSLHHSQEDRTYLAKCLVLPNTFWQGLIESP
jgi:hypothetical protein